MFPPSFPKNCPPKDATPAGEVVYRIVADDPPTDGDFLSHKELGKPCRDACLGCGLSVFPNLGAARRLYTHMLNLFGDALELGDKVARCQLTPAHGHTKQTGRPPHMTWWPYDGVVRRHGFIVVTESTDVEG